MAKGFTLIETVVAISILVIGTAGSFTLMRQTTSSASAISSQLVAYYLAQEGVEIIRNIRDTNYLQGRAWDALIGGASASLDYRSQEFPSAICGDYLKYDDNARAYLCSDDGNFKRIITVEKIDLDKMLVSAQVSWLSRGAWRQVSVETELRDWR